MGTKDEIMLLIDEINTIQTTKRDAISNQHYEIATMASNKEKQLLDKLDEISGVKDFYTKTYDTEKILQHLEILVHSTEELKKLRPHFSEVFQDLDIDKYLITLYKQRDEAYKEAHKIKTILK